MKFFKQKGNSLTLVAPAAVASGAGVMVGSLFGVAAGKADSGGEVEMLREGVFSLAKVSTEAWAIGDPIYWNNTTKLCSKSVVGQLVGIANMAATNPSTRGTLVLTPSSASAVNTFVDPVTGGKGLLFDGVALSILPRSPVLNGASAGTNSGWLPLATAPERFAYQLDSGSTVTGFSIDISADGVSSLGQAFTGTYDSSAVAEITFPIMFSNPLAKYFRWTVLSGGPLSVSRGV